MQDIRNGIWSVIKRFVLAALSTIGVFMLFGWILDKLEYTIYSRMVASSGQNVILVTGIVGTPLHEIAHWIGCKIFGFTIIDVDLFRPMSSYLKCIFYPVTYALQHIFECFPI